MPYTTNKNMPRIRREAVQLTRRGWSARKVGRHLGFHHTAVLEWIKRAKIIGNHPIPTMSSKPKHHPKELSEDIIKKIVEKRLAHNRYAEAVHKELENDGIKVSLSSVKRTLERRYLIKKRSPCVARTVLATQRKNPPSSRFFLPLGGFIYIFFIFFFNLIFIKKINNTISIFFLSTFYS